MRYPSLAIVLAATSMACGAAPDEASSSLASAATASGAATITFAAGFTQSATPLVAGQQAQVSYDASRLSTCRGELGYGSGVGWSIDGLYSVNGIAFQSPIGVAGADLANLALAPGALPSFTLPFAGTLQMWFENSDVFACTAWDSNYGANYSFTIAPPANAPGWVSGGSYLLDRATCPGACYADAHTADGGLTFDTWARQDALITQIFFDVWSAGVTDFDNPDLWQQLDVEVHSRTSPSQPFTMAYVDFATRVGDNARYALDLRPIDLLPGNSGGVLTSASQCPAIPATVTADSQYVQANLELYFTVNGVAVQPSGGGTFHVTFQNYAGLYAICGYPKAS
jgi:hypothetical protein